MPASFKWPDTVAQQFYRPFLFGTAGTAFADLHDRGMRHTITSLGINPAEFTLPLAFTKGVAWGVIEVIGVHMALETIVTGLVESPSAAFLPGLAYWVTRATIYNGSRQLSAYFEQQEK